MWPCSHLTSLKLWQAERPKRFKVVDTRKEETHENMAESTVSARTEEDEHAWPHIQRFYHLKAVQKNNYVFSVAVFSASQNEPTFQCEKTQLM